MHACTRPQQEQREEEEIVKVYWLNLQLKLPTSNYDVSTNKIIWKRVKPNTHTHLRPQKRGDQEC